MLTSLRVSDSSSSHFLTQPTVSTVVGDCAAIEAKLGYAAGEQGKVRARTNACAAFLKHLSAVCRTTDCAARRQAKRRRGAAAQFCACCRPRVTLVLCRSNRNLTPRSRPTSSSCRSAAAAAPATCLASVSLAPRVRRRPPCRWRTNG